MLRVFCGFSGRLGSVIVCCLHLKIEFRLCGGVASFITIVDKKLQKSEAAFFSMQPMLRLDIPFLSD